MTHNPSPSKKKAIKIDSALHKKLKKAAAEKELTIGDLGNIAVELLLEILNSGIPDSLGYMLQSKNPKLLNKLVDLVRR